MKLISLWVENYKNLHNFKMDFTDSKVTMLIGTNGSGKSNILEVLSEIFYGLYKSATPELSFNCEISYEINNQKIVFLRKSGYKYMTLGECDINLDEYKQNRELYLPSRIITSYSGETKRLWESYYSSIYKEYTDKLIDAVTPTLRMQYINHYHWSIILIILSIFKSEEYSKLKLPGIKSVEFRFSNRDIKGFVKNDVVKLLEKLNYTKNGKYSCSFDNLKKTFDTDYIASDLFNLFVLASLPKDQKFITNIGINFGSYTMSSLSEGENKKLLLKAIYEILADQDTLVLLDEPDTYIHESEKSFLRELINAHNEDVGYTVLTTHSSVLTSLFNTKEIKGLQKSSSNITVVNKENFDLLDSLFGSKMSRIITNDYIQSDKPFLVLEGKDDVNYISKALEVLKVKNEKYKILDFNIISCNGTGNAQYFKSEIEKIMPSDKKYIYIFDRDDAGKDAFAKLLGIKKGNINKKEKYHKISDNVYAVMYISSGTKNYKGNFILEDYFSDNLINSFVEKFIQENKSTRFRSAPKLDIYIKSQIENQYDSNKIPDNEFEGFSSLFDVLIEIVEEFKK